MPKWLDKEAAVYATKGYALAGVTGNCRVYRGNGQTPVEGKPTSQRETDEVQDLVEKIVRLGGHIGCQAPFDGRYSRPPT